MLKNTGLDFHGQVVVGRSLAADSRVLKALRCGQPLRRIDDEQLANKVLGRFRDAAPVLRLKCIAAVLNLLEQLEIVFAVEGRIATQP